jgi:hypothetical protein
LHLINKVTGKEGKHKMAEKLSKEERQAKKSEKEKLSKEERKQKKAEKKMSRKNG